MNQGSSVGGPGDISIWNWEMLPYPSTNATLFNTSSTPVVQPKKNGTGEKQMEANKGKVSFYHSYPLTQTYGSLEALIGSFLVFCVRT